MIKRSFPPVVDARTRVLVLGSLPGEASLAAGRYYAHPRNQFWRLIGAVIDEPDLALLAYETRLARLLQAGVGLWDVVEEAEREGSLDAAIRNHRANPLAELAARLPELRAIGFNGGKAFTAGSGLLSGGDLTLIRLPSSSPAHAAALQVKLAGWMHLTPFLAGR